jgi:MFS family permease
MERRAAAAVLMAVLGTGVFLAGLELMITAVALPSILADLADWTELRRASWIVNGYLLVTVITMPLAGRLADLWGARRLILLGLAAFTVGSALAGRAQTLDELIAARLVQAVGGGILIPVGTAAASHLFGGRGRPRALGVIGALTFLGMAVGPFLGAAILETVHPDVALARLGIEPGQLADQLADQLAPAWRYVFYVNVPIGLAGLALAWAAMAGWDTPRRPARLDLPGAAILTVALGALLVGVTLIGSPDDLKAGFEATTTIAAFLGIAAAATVLLVVAGFMRRDPFVDPRLFREPGFASAALVSLLTGYAFATAIVGGAVFVDRVLYGGAGDQRVALGALAGATALGALGAGLVLGRLGFRLVSIAGLAASVGGLLVMATWNPATSIPAAAIALGAFGAGFGLTVTPRSTAAVESVGRSAYGAASATVTVARMIGMAIGLAVLTAYGSTTIDRLYDEVYATPDAYRAFIPEELRGRPRNDGLVAEALEAWAAREATLVMAPLFLGAAAVTAAATPAALVMGARRRRADDEDDDGGFGSPLAAPPAAGASGPGSGAPAVAPTRDDDPLADHGPIPAS